MKKLSRRSFLTNTSQLTLSASAIAMLSGYSGLASAAKVSDKAVQNDIKILNSAIGAEHEAVAAYQVGAESGLLQKEVLTAMKLLYGAITSAYFVLPEVFYVMTKTRRTLFRMPISFRLNN